MRRKNDNSRTAAIVPDGPLSPVTSEELLEICALEAAGLDAVRLSVYCDSVREAITLVKSQMTAMKSFYAAASRDFLPAMIDSETGRLFTEDEGEKALREKDGEFLQKYGRALTMHKQLAVIESGTLRDEAAAIMVELWVSEKPFRIPLCLWSDQAIAEFLSQHVRTEVTIDHVRRRRDHWELRQSARVIVLGVDDDGDYTRLKFGNRRRSVAGQI